MFHRHSGAGSRQPNRPQPLSDPQDVKFDSVISSWVAANISRILKAYVQKGGWEGWAQVELAFALKNHLDQEFSTASDALDAIKAMTTRVWREEPVYPPVPTSKGGISQKRADIVIEFGPSSHREFVIIELKCEGFHNKDAFVRAVQEDIVKVEGDILDEYKPARVWSFAISSSQNAYEEMDRKRPGADRQELYPAAQGGVYLHPNELKSLPVDVKIVLWMFEKEILKR